MSRVADQVVSDIVFVIKNGWRNAPKGYGPQTPHIALSAGADRIFADAAGQAAGPVRLIIDSTHLKTHRTAVHPPVSAAREAGERRQGPGRQAPSILLLTPAQMSDHKGAGLHQIAYWR